jgi:hypothetical protein
MKKVIIILSLLLLSFTNSYGQWYVKKYHKSDINLLSKEQLQESLESSRKGILYSGLTAGMGTLIYVLGKNKLFDLPENPTFVEQLLGRNGINALTAGVGAALFAGSAISAISYMKRTGKIKTALSKQRQSFGSVYIAPKIFTNDHLESYQIGVSLTYHF